MIQRKAFKKWLFISVLCGAHSFFWGAMTKASPLAMLLGLLTLALAFAVLESHAFYQARRAAAPRLARALDAGVKFRCWLAVYIPLTLVLGGAFGAGAHSGWLFTIFGAPYMAELLIGMGALSLTNMLTGLDFMGGPGHPALTGGDNFGATYLTTLFTGLAHTIILGVMCLIAYGAVRLRSRGAHMVPDDGAQT